MNIKKLQSIAIILTMSIGLFSCSKESASSEESVQEVYLKFKNISNNKDKVLYSNWLKSQFPTSSLNNTEFFNLPLIQNKFLDLDKDLVLVYGKRNNIFNLPVTIPASLESYAVELISGPMGTTTRLRVSSLDLSPLQDIFFRSTAEAQFRVIIIPGEKLLSLKSETAVNFEKMTYLELSRYFGLPE